jgi:hypothetical protein
MLSVELSKREITAPGLYIMRWKNRTGLARITGNLTKGFMLIAPENTPETYMSDLPKDGQLPNDAFFSEPLAIVVL